MKERLVLVLGIVFNLLLIFSFVVLTSLNCKAFSTSQYEMLKDVVLSSGFDYYVIYDTYERNATYSRITWVYCTDDDTSIDVTSSRISVDGEGVIYAFNNSMVPIYGYWEEGFINKSEYWDYEENQQVWSNVGDIGGVPLPSFSEGTEKGVLNVETFAKFVVFVFVFKFGYRLTISSIDGFGSWRR